MAFPRTLNEMVPSGYKFNGGGTCKNCGSDLEWWETPTGKKIPMDPMPHGSSMATPHFKTCSD